MEYVTEDFLSCYASPFLSRIKLPVEQSNLDPFVDSGPMPLSIRSVDVPLQHPKHYLCCWVIVRLAICNVWWMGLRHEAIPTRIHLE